MSRSPETATYAEELEAIASGYQRDTGRLRDQLAERSDQLAAARGIVADLEARLAATEADRDRKANALHAANNRLTAAILVLEALAAYDPDAGQALDDLIVDAGRVVRGGL